MRGRSGSGWILGAVVLVAAPAGCAALLGLDEFSESAATTGSGMGTGGAGAGGGAASSSTGGGATTSSGTGGALSCVSSSECPQPPASSHAMATCSKGQCDFVCDPGHDNCDGDFTKNGCEVDLETDAAHCGSCNNACAVPKCSQHVCNNPIGVAAGIYHTCAVLLDQSVWCWGKNGNGELGDGTNITRTKPVSILPPGSATKVVAGGDETSPFTCALMTSNEVRCWGGNAHGQLGLNSTQDKNTPQLVALQAVIDVEVGGGHTCAIKNPGDLYCWGDNSNGQLGDGKEGTVVLAPPSSPISSGVTQVGLGRDHTCATGNSAQCWGDVGFGKCGKDSFVNQLTPGTVSFGGNVTVSEFALGQDHTCARAGSSLYCFGRNYQGEVGANDTSTSTFASPQLLTLAEVKLVSLGLAQWSGAIAGVDDAVYTWGFEQDECLGNGAAGADTVYAPAKTGLTGVKLLSLGYLHACALKKTSGELVCWGNNIFGEVGDGTISPNRNVPTPVLW
jgi:alpha-tubulin suppressor-like RCC1 family protein